MNDRGRLSRNPISVLVFIGLAEVAGAQIFDGPKGSAVLLSLDHSTQVMFAYLLLASSLLVLLGAAMPEPRAYWLEAGGKAGCAIALGVYTFTLQQEVSSPQTSLGFVFSTIATACILRIIWLTWLIITNFYPRLAVRLVVLKARIALKVRRLVRFRR